MSLFKEIQVPPTSHLSKLAEESQAPSSWWRVNSPARSFLFTLQNQASTAPPKLWSPAKTFSPTSNTKRPSVLAIWSRPQLLLTLSTLALTAPPKAFSSSLLQVEKLKRMFLFLPPLTLKTWKSNSDQSSRKAKKKLLSAFRSGVISSRWSLSAKVLTCELLL